jgi:tryptophan synthase alpha chain
VSRIASTFAALRAERRLGLIAYLTVGYPNLAITPALVETAARSGADAIELGIPFSDPLADGRTIQAASQAALRGGVTVARALETATAARRKTDVPMLFMTYVNPILAFGLDRFCRAAAAAGIDGLIVPDLPPAESEELRRAADAARLATGFIYCIAVTGVTGARAQLDSAVLPLIATVRQQTSLPVVVGFGISRPEHLQALEGHADGAIVASALLDAIAQAPDDATGQVGRFLTELRRKPLS